MIYGKPVYYQMIAYGKCSKIYKCFLFQQPATKRTIFAPFFICLCSVQSITNVRKAMQSLGCALCGLEQL
jgi:hypothetical protein